MTPWGSPRDGKAGSTHRHAMCADKGRNHTTISTDAEKASDKTQCLFMTELIHLGLDGALVTC